MSDETLEGVPEARESEQFGEVPAPSGLPAPVRAMRAAFVFLTRLPVGGFPYSADDWRWAPAHFPLAGMAVGAIAAGVLWVTLPLGSLLAAALTVAASALLTGAFHEDGLADTADALGGAHGPKQIHVILKDSRIGTYGALALGMSLLVRVLALSELGAAALVWLVPMHAVVRTGPVWLMTCLSYVSGEGAKGSSVARGGQLRQSLVATVWAVVACGVGLSGVVFGVGASPLHLGALVVGTSLVTALLGLWFRARAGGFTGDFLGATEQVGEMFWLVGVVAMTRSGL